MNINEQANFIWSIADLLRGDFKQSEYGKVILPFTVLRRFDCVLAPSKARILEANKTLTVSNKRPIFKRMTGHDYYNISQFDFEKLMDDSTHLRIGWRYRETASSPGAPGHTRSIPPLLAEQRYNAVRCAAAARSAPIASAWKCRDACG